MLVETTSIATATAAIRAKTYPAPSLSAGDIIRGVPLFSHLCQPEIDIVAKHAVETSYSKNTIIIQEGDRTDSLYVIVSGKVKVFLSDEDGKEVILSFVGPGEYFGEIALLDESPRSASIMTADETKLLIISKSSLKECIATNPDVAITLIKELTNRLRRSTENIRTLALKDVYGRVTTALLHMAKPQGDDLVVPEKLTQQDIANMVGSSREMVSRIFKELTVGGYVSMDDHLIHIHKPFPRKW